MQAGFPPPFILIPDRIIRQLIEVNRSVIVGATFRQRLVKPSNLVVFLLQLAVDPLFFRTLLFRPPAKVRLTQTLNHGVVAACRGGRGLLALVSAGRDRVSNGLQARVEMRPKVLGGS